MADYDTDAKALVALCKTALTLNDNDVKFIGAYDPEEYRQTVLSVGGSTRVWIGWVRLYNVELGTDGVSTISHQYAVNVTKGATFEECLADTLTVRDALNGATFRVGTSTFVGRTVLTSDGFPLIDDDNDTKTIQLFVDIR